MKHKSVNETIVKKLQKRIIKDFKKYELEKNPSKRAEIFHEITTRMYYEWVLEVDKMNDKLFEKLENERFDEFEAMKSKMLDKAFQEKVQKGDLKFEEIGFYAFDFDVEKTDKIKYAKEVDKALNKKKTLSRLYKLELLSRWSYQLALLDMLGSMSSMQDLEKLVKRRFNFDSNWILATSILTVHENLIKKKCIDLGITEEKIRKILKEKKFQGLVDFIGKEIESEEKRKLSLVFYKSPAIRAVRNKLEHEGYKQEVTKDDVIDLLKEIKKFEKELYRD